MSCSMVPKKTFLVVVFILICTVELGLYLIYSEESITSSTGIPRTAPLAPSSVFEENQEISSKILTAPSLASSWNSEGKQEIYRKLAEVHRELKNALAHKTPPSPKALLKLQGILQQLDPTHTLSEGKEKVAESNNTSSNREVLDVCPEEYHGSKYGYPFFHTGWVMTNCTNVKKLPQILSILLNTMEYPEPVEKQVDVVLRGINKLYPGVKVYVAPKNNQIKEVAKKYKDTTIINVSTGISLGTVWNQLISQVSTPYTLIARDLVHFDFNVRVERQIRMISNTDHVGVVGGAFRNLTGHWRVGCRQTEMMNYVLEYQEGYHHSKNSCMFCDDLEGPFVAKTAILKSTKFNEKLPKEVVFEDFFIRVVRSRSLVMNCPDVMYFTTDYSTEAKRNNKNSWRSFAVEWKLVRVLLPGEIRHAFSCDEISYKCSMGVTKYAALPMCCLEQFGRAMKFFHDFAMEHNIRYELDAGSVLAAVKFNNYSPFDIDGDMIVLSWNLSIIKQHEQYFKKHGFVLTSYTSPAFDDKGDVKTLGYMSYYTPDIWTEVWGFASISADKFLPPELRDIKYYTKVRINGHWINCMFSPGLYARNRYGREVLKHSQSWRYVGGMADSWALYKPGNFLACTQPNFHSCLDKFPVDGNIGFKVT